MTATQTRQTSEIRRASLGSVVFGVLMIAVGAGWLLEQLGAFDFEPALLLPTLLTGVGIALIIGAWDGEHAGLVILGVILSLFTVLAAVAPAGSFRGGVGDRVYVPASVDELAPGYQLAVGQLDLDLRNLEDVGRRRIEVRIGAGEVRIVLPDDVAVAVDARVQAGEVNVFGETTAGIDVSRRFVTPGFESAEDRIVLDIDVIAGSVEVTR